MSIANILLILLAVAYLMGKRLAGLPLTDRSALIPLVLLGYGLYSLNGVHVNAADWAVLAVEALIGLVAGVIRGITIKIYPRDGHLWMRYTPLTVAVWVATIAARIGVGVVGRELGAASTTATIMAMFGLTMLIETLVVRQRASAHTLATGVPLAPGRPRR